MVSMAGVKVRHLTGCIFCMYRIRLAAIRNSIIIGLAGADCCVPDQRQVQGTMV